MSTRSSRSGWPSRCSPASPTTRRDSSTGLRSRPRSSRRACGAWVPARWNRCGSACRELTIPVLLVTGTRDPKFTAIARRMLDRLPDAEHREIDAGHALPLEQPGELGGAIADFARQARSTTRTVYPPSSYRNDVRIAQPQPGREQRGQHELEPDGPHERADQRRRIGPGEHEPGRRDRERRGGQREQRPGMPDRARPDGNQRTDQTARVEQPGAPPRRCAPRACACRRPRRCRRRARCSRAGCRRPAGRPPARPTTPRPGARGTARTRCRASRRSRRTRAPSPRRARDSRTASGHRCR